MATIKVLVVDDHLLFRKGLCALIESRDEIHVVGEASDGLEALGKAADLHPDVVLMDVHMPVMGGIHAVQQIKHDLPQTKVVMLTISDEDEDLFAAIRAGADGYLLKSLNPEELVDRVLEVTRDETPLSAAVATKLLRQFRRQTVLEAPVGSAASLSPREREVLIMVARGTSNKEIAHRLTLTEGTVKNHLHNILKKLHLQNRVQATAIAIQEGLTAAARAEPETE